MMTARSSDFLATVLGVVCFMVGIVVSFLSNKGALAGLMHCQTEICGQTLPKVG